MKLLSEKILVPVHVIILKYNNDTQTKCMPNLSGPQNYYEYMIG